MDLCSTYVVESKHEKGVIYTGSNDGRVHLTKDNGTTWTNVTPKGLPETFPLQINDIEIQEGSNRIWIWTKAISGVKGGRFFYSDDGTYFTPANPTYDVAPTNVERTEIASSYTNSGTHYVLMRANGEAELYKTVDNFVNLTKLAEPADVGPRNSKLRFY